MGWRINKVIINNIQKTTASVYSFRPNRHEGLHIKVYAVVALVIVYFIYSFTREI